MNHNIFVIHPFEFSFNSFHLKLPHKLKKYYVETSHFLAYHLTNKKGDHALSAQCRGNSNHDLNSTDIVGFGKKGREGLVCLFRQTDRIR